VLGHFACVPAPLDPQGEAGSRRAKMVAGITVLGFAGG
jgi:hypothetical protein